MSLLKETIADIVAQIRAAAYIQNADTPRSVLHLADRIEAAWKRERDELTYSFDHTMAGHSKAPDHSAYAIEGMKGFEEWKRNKEPSVGNAAAMRGALESCLDFIMRIDRAFNPFMQNLLANAISKAQSSLSAPPRNFDVGTANQQSKRFSDFCSAHRHTDLPRCAGCPLENTPQDTGCSFAWAQMPYEADTKKEERNDAE